MSSKVATIVTTTLLLSLIFQWIATTQAIYQPKNYIVGDGFGWSLTISMEAWAQGKKFYAGDKLVFNYDYQLLLDVVVVDKQGHDTCTETEGSTEYCSGHDIIALNFGENYFICSDSSACAGGMKMAINATAPPPTLAH